MQESPKINLSWLNVLWRHRLSVLAGVLALISISLAHYAGFLMKVPLQIVAVAGVELAAGVTAAFLFYVLFSAVIARVAISSIQLFMLPLLAIIDRIKQGRPWKMKQSQVRKFVRQHSETIRLEGHVWPLFQIPLFLIILLGLYVDFTLNWTSGILIAISMVSGIASYLVRFGFFLQPKPVIFVQKVRERVVRYGKVASAAFVTTSASFVIVAFIMGSLRADLLREQHPQTIESEAFKGKASVLASSKHVFLLFQSEGGGFRYIYSTPELTTSVGKEADNKQTKTCKK